MDAFSDALTQSLPAYLSALPVPRTVDELTAMTPDQVCLFWRKGSVLQQRQVSLQQPMLVWFEGFPVPRFAAQKKNTRDKIADRAWKGARRTQHCAAGGSSSSLALFHTYCDSVPLSLIIFLNEEVYGGVGVLELLPQVCWEIQAVVDDINLLSSEDDGFLCQCHHTSCCCFKKTAVSVFSPQKHTLVKQRTLVQGTSNHLFITGPPTATRRLRLAHARSSGRRVPEDLTRLHVLPAFPG